VDETQRRPAKRRFLKRAFTRGDEQCSVPVRRLQVNVGEHVDTGELAQGFVGND
jgi:hypothetical protein